jgi:hypothetical protein
VLKEDLMALPNSNEMNAIGLEDETWKNIPSDVAKSLLCVFATQDAESRLLGTALVSIPNGKDLYVTSRHGAFFC